MGQLTDETAKVVSNEAVGPRLHVLTLHSPDIAARCAPGQFVHLKVPGHAEHVLRRPFSIYDVDEQAGTLDILYQEVGSVTSLLPRIKEGSCSLIGPVGKGWTGPERVRAGLVGHALLVGGGVGAAPLLLMARQLVRDGASVDVVLGAQSAAALVCCGSYEALLGREPICCTDDGSYGIAGFCTEPVGERLQSGCVADGDPYDYVAVCGPEPLMRLVSALAADAGIYCEVSLERRMACGIGACLSCVVETVDGKRRSCVDGPVFPADKVVW